MHGPMLGSQVSLVSHKQLMGVVLNYVIGEQLLLPPCNAAHVRLDITF